MARKYFNTAEKNRSDVNLITGYVDVQSRMALEETIDAIFSEFGLADQASLETIKDIFAIFESQSMGYSIEVFYISRDWLKDLCSQASLTQIIRAKQFSVAQAQAWAMALLDIFETAKLWHDGQNIPFIKAWTEVKGRQIPWFVADIYLDLPGKKAGEIYDLKSACGAIAAQELGEVWNPRGLLDPKDKALAQMKNAALLAVQRRRENAAKNGDGFHIPMDDAEDEAAYYAEEMRQGYDDQAD